MIFDNPLMLALGGGLASVIVILIFVIKIWVWPLKHSVAEDFVRAYRERKRVAIMDDGVRFNVFVCEKTADGYYRHSPGKNEPNQGIIELTPKSERTMDGGIRAVVGNYETMEAVNTQVAKICSLLMKEGITYDQIKTALNAMDDMLEAQAAKTKTPEVKHEASETDTRQARARHAEVPGHSGRNKRSTDPADTELEDERL